MRNRFKYRNRPRRARRLTREGRATLLVIGLAIVGLTVWGVSAGRPTRSAPDARASALPPVSAPPPVARPDPVVRVADLPLLLDPPTTRNRFEGARLEAAAVDPSGPPRLVEWVSPDESDLARRHGPLRVEYTLDERLSERIFSILRRGRVSRGHAIVLDPRTGRLLAFVSTDEAGFSAKGTYPAASIVKILTASALLVHEPKAAAAPCLYRGNPYRLSGRRLSKPKSGRESSLEKALGTSNNQCFAQWALHTLGEQRMRETFRDFGWLSPAVPGYPAGSLEEIDTKLDLGRLGSGLDGVRISPMHIAQLASTLTSGNRIEPWWVDRVVDAYDRVLPMPPRSEARRVLSEETAAQLRRMLVSTTRRGTARSAFRDRRGRAKLSAIEVAGKTGNLTGSEPYGRYEWFIGLAPAREPELAVVVLQLQSNMWWSRSTELAADIMRVLFCEKRECNPGLAKRWTGELDREALPLLASDLARPGRSTRVE